MALAWIIYATRLVQMRDVRGDAVLAYCEPRTTKQMGQDG